MFPNRMQRPQGQIPKKKEDGCKIKIKRGKDGKISSIESSGKCSKQEMDMVRGKVAEEIEDGE